MEAGLECVEKEKPDTDRCLGLGRCCWRCTDMEMFYTEPSQSNPPSPELQTLTTYNPTKKEPRLPAAMPTHRVFPFLKFTFGFYSAAMTPIAATQ